jgi:homoserine kinase type II
MLDVPALFAHWSHARPRAVTVPEDGVLNQTFVVDTDGGRYVLRAYRPLRRERIRREHALIAYVAGHGLPAPGPLPSRDGETLLERDGRFYALFPYVEGRRVPRPVLTGKEAAATGRFLARLHDVLAGYAGPCPTERELSSPPDRARTVAEIEDLLRLVPPDDAVARGRLESRRAWLLERPAPGHPDLCGIPFQVLHGDYQETNLFFDDAGVCGVIDWDQAYRGPRGWEVVRALDFMLGFDPLLCAAFLRAYRARLALSDEDLDLAASAYAEMRANDLWLFTEIYREGNDRARRYLHPGQFVPVTDRWAALRNAMADYGSAGWWDTSRIGR